MPRSRSVDFEEYAVGTVSEMDPKYEPLVVGRVERDGAWTLSMRHGLMEKQPQEAKTCSSCVQAWAASSFDFPIACTARANPESRWTFGLKSAQLSCP